MFNIGDEDMKERMKIGGAKIIPEKITKPIQLLAVWLSALIIIEAAYIAAALTTNDPIWLSTLFAISAIAFVPIFLIFVFLLQTRFRVEIQEDPYFLEYKLNQMTGEKSANDIIQASVKESFGKVSTEILNINAETQRQIGKVFNYIENSNKQLLNDDNFTFMKENIKNTGNKIKKLQGFLEWSEMIIKVNSSLERYDDIIKVLKENSIAITGTFGRDQMLEKEEVFLLSFGRLVPFKYIMPLIKMLLPFGLQYIQCIRPIFGEQYDKGIYIGAFTYRDKYEVTELNEDLIDKIEKIDSNAAFISLINSNLKLLYK